VKLDSTAINQYRFALDTNAAPQNYAIAQQAKLASDGQYYVMVATHAGDTRGTPWYTDCICLATNATYTAAQAPGTVVPQQAYPNAAAINNGPVTNQ
jgi:hypothetical protein